jgi:hypothetical protein
LQQHGSCHINLERTWPFGQKNGAVSEDCAEPHENPNLTLDYLTGKRGIRSNRIQEKAGAVNGGICLIRFSRMEWPEPVWSFGA